MMISNYILLAMSVATGCVAVYAIFHLDHMPEDCKPLARKEFGLILIWSLSYFVLEADWIINNYFAAVEPSTEYGWTVNEAMTMIIFLLIMKHELNCIARPIGEILVERGYVKKEDLCNMLEEQRGMRRRCRWM